MADRKDRIDVIRMRMPGARGAELTIAWPRALARAIFVGSATIVILLIGMISDGYASVGMRGAVGLGAICALVLTLFSYYLERFHAARLKPFDSAYRQWMFAILVL
ncbi:MAG: hypothetical protein KDB07_01325, partial [Planctomycetes bacterium]|nr:hypothetical protein [Planctomycetota bacterium]